MARQRIKMTKNKNPWKAGIKSTDVKGNQEAYRRNYDKWFGKNEKQGSQVARRQAHNLETGCANHPPAINNPNCS